MGFLDIAGSEIKINDNVATTQWVWWKRKTSSDLMIAKVVGFTKKKVRIEFTDEDGEVFQTTKFSSQIAVIEKLPYTDDNRPLIHRELTELRDSAYSKWQNEKSPAARANYELMEKATIAIERIEMLRQMYGVKNESDGKGNSSGS